MVVVKGVVGNPGVIEVSELGVDVRLDSVSRHMEQGAIVDLAGFCAVGRLLGVTCSFVGTSRLTVCVPSGTLLDFGQDDGMWSCC